MSSNGDQESLLTIERAQANHSRDLSELALRSKSYWPYEKEFIERCRSELIVSEEMINLDSVFIGIVEKNIIGFCSFSKNSDEVVMEHLFVDPKYIGKGLGKKLWMHSLAFAESQGWESFKLCADPFAAEKFYLPMGCTKVGEVESSVQKGRMLPLLEYTLDLL
jgi:GNAT superfamily N-acetyltransferase